MTSLQDELYDVARALRERILHEADWGLAGHERTPQDQRTAPIQAFVRALQPAAPAPPAAPVAPVPVAQTPAPLESPASEVVTAIHPAIVESIPIAELVAPLPPIQRAPSGRPAPDLSIFGNLPSGTPGLQHIQTVLGECQRCDLHAERTQLVFGRGNPEADVVFIGEAPGDEEDLEGQPFVGPAGQLLERMIQAMGLQPDQAYITNVVKCRTPSAREPEIEERLKCRPFLVGQVQATQPRVIVTLGRIATQTVLETDGRISQLRGRWHSHPHHDSQVMPTYHPTAVLRNPQLRRPVWEDLKRVVQALGLHTNT